MSSRVSKLRLVADNNFSVEIHDEAQWRISADPKRRALRLNNFLYGVSADVFVNDTCDEITDISCFTNIGNRDKKLDDDKAKNLLK